MTLDRLTFTMTYGGVNVPAKVSAGEADELLHRVAERSQLILETARHGVADGRGHQVVTVAFPGELHGGSYAIVHGIM